MCVSFLRGDDVRCLLTATPRASPKVRCACIKIFAWISPLVGPLLEIDGEEGLN